MMSKIPNDEETVRKMLVELRVLEGSANLMRSRLSVVDNALNEIVIANLSLDGAKNNSLNTEVLVPAGAGSFIRAKLTDVNKVIIGIGAGVSIERSIEDSIIDLKNRQNELEKVKNKKLELNPELIRKLKQIGMSDAYIADLTGLDELELRELRKSYNVTPVYKMVDTCGGEFEAATPYYYSTYEEEDEARVS